MLLGVEEVASGGEVGHDSIAMTACATRGEHQRVDGRPMREIVDGATGAVLAMALAVHPAATSSSSRQRTRPADT